MKNTKIPWCDHTFNPWEGCEEAGTGCKNCFAKARNARFHGGTAPNWGKGAPRRRTSPANWKKPETWEREHAEFFAVHGRRQRVFCLSLGDVFDPAVDPAWRVDLFKLIRATPHLDWLLLTKRIGHAKAMLDEAMRGLYSQEEYTSWESNPWPNVSLGATIVNQAEADRDIGPLLATPAVRRFLSIEPLLGPISFRWAKWVDRNRMHREFGCEDELDGLRGIDQVIVGGETGTNARPQHPAWLRRLRDQCRQAGVAFNFKAWGEWIPRSRCYHVMDDGRSADEIDPSCKLWPTIRLTERGLDGRQLKNVDSGDDCYMQRVGRTVSGRLLDGVEHDEYPGHVTNQELVANVGLGAEDIAKVLASPDWKSSI